MNNGASSAMTAALLCTRSLRNRNVFKRAELRNSSTRAFSVDGSVQGPGQTPEKQRMHTDGHIQAHATAMRLCATCVRVHC
eukprot:1659106-Alexandrium_andersonii.AAC.1